MAMKRLLSAFVIVLFSSSAFAQQAELLDSVSVSASRLPLSLASGARPVTMIDSAAVSSIPVQSINDILKFAPGVDVRQRGAGGIQTDIGIRGGSFDQTALLLNGVNISDPQTGHNAFSLPVDVRDIERIEVLGGPASRAYHASSLYGAINIVTRPRRSFGGYAYLEGGSFAYAGAGASAGIGKGGFDMNLSVGAARSDGYLRNSAGKLNSDYRTLRAFCQAVWERPLFRLDFQAGINLKGYGASTFYSSKYDDQYEKVFKSYVSLGAGGSAGPLHLKALLYWNHGHDRFELFRSDESKVPFNYHNTNVLGLNAGGWFETVAGRTSLGAEFRNEGIESTNLGEPLPSPKGRYVVGLNRTQMNCYLEHAYTGRIFSISGGFNLARNTLSDEGFGFYPGIDASVRPGGAWKLYASYNFSHRAPSFTELYYSVGGHQADKNLRPEKMHAVEIGAGWQPRGVKITASVYYHHGLDIIDWVRVVTADPDTPWQSVNHGVIRGVGEELTARIDFETLLGRTFFVKSFSAGYSHIWQDKTAVFGIQSLYALEYLRNKLVLQLDLRLWKALVFDITYRFQDRAGAYSPYSLLDAKLRWDGSQHGLSGFWKGTGAFVEATNILNTRYFDYGDIPQPPFALRAGVCYNF